MGNHNAKNIVNEIQSLIKALKDCGGWVKRGNGEGWFNHEILADSLALINSQEQRIKELTEENERLREYGINYETPWGKHTIPKRLSLEGDAARLYTQIENKIKADTVRKMQILIEEKSDSCDLYQIHSNKPVDVIYQISKKQLDQIAKEMLEEETPNNTNTCISCGESIPEGRQVCPKCEESYKGKC